MSGCHDDGDDGLDGGEWAGDGQVVRPGGAVGGRYQATITEVYLETEGQVLKLKALLIQDSGTIVEALDGGSQMSPVNVKK